MKARRGISGEQMESTGSILTVWPGVYQCGRTWGSASVPLLGYPPVMVPPPIWPTTLPPKTRREMLDWQIRRDRKRLAETKARLAGEAIGTRRYIDDYIQ